MEEFDLKDVIREAHGNQGPSMWTMGKQQINVILVTRLLHVKACRYLPFIHSVGDHRSIWVDIPHEEILGHCTPRFPTKTAPKLITLNPRVTKNISHT